jgi:molybdopterin-guanine dinucleotide biosynthesis protein A
MPLLHHPILRLAQVCSDVVVVLSPDAEEPRPPEGVHVRFVRDDEPFAGPLAGLAAGLATMRTELALVAAGDMPDLQTRVLLAMLGRIEDPAIRAVALEESGELRPLPCVVRVEPVRAAAVMLLEQGRTSLRELLGTIEVETMSEDGWLALDPGRRSLVDVDEPGDLTGYPSW